MIDFIPYLFGTFPRYSCSSMFGRWWLVNAPLDIKSRPINMVEYGGQSFPETYRNMWYICLCSQKTKHGLVWNSTPKIHRGFSSFSTWNGSCTGRMGTSAGAVGNADRPPWAPRSVQQPRQRNSVRLGRLVMLHGRAGLVLVGTIVYNWIT